MRDRKRAYIFLGTVIFFALAAEILFAEPHHHMIWNTLPGADVIIGFAGAWLLILLAKKLMAPLLQRREDYYEARETCRYGKEKDSAFAGESAEAESGEKICLKGIYEENGGKKDA